MSKIVTARHVSVPQNILTMRLRLGLCTDPAGRFYSAPPDPSWIWGRGKGWPPETAGLDPPLVITHLSTVSIQHHLQMYVCMFLLAS